MVVPEIDFVLRKVAAERRENTAQGASPGIRVQYIPAVERRKSRIRFCCRPAGAQAVPPKFPWLTPWAIYIFTAPRLADMPATFLKDTTDLFE